MTEPQVPKRPRHLMDPNNLQPSVRTEGMSIDGVQKWVLSVLAATTILHMAVGLVIAAVVIDDSRRDAQIGLCVLAACFGILSVGAAVAIHRKPILTPWLLLGLLPGIVGIVICFR